MPTKYRIAIIGHTGPGNHGHGIDTVWLEAESSRYDFFIDVVMQTRPDIALVALDSDPAKGLALVAKISQELPECNVLVISSSTEGSLILQAMRNGAKEFLSLPLKIEDVLSKRCGPLGSQTRAGACGRTVPT